MTDKAFEATQLIEALAEVDAPTLCERYDQALSAVVRTMENDISAEENVTERANLGYFSAQATEALNAVADVFIEEAEEIESPAAGRSAAKSFCNEIRQR